MNRIICMYNSIGRINNSSYRSTREIIINNLHTGRISLTERIQEVETRCMVKALTKTTVSPEKYG